MAQLTEEQRAFWDGIGFSLPPENPSQDEWRQFVSGMQYVFHLDGHDAPSEEALRAEVERRRKGEGSCCGGRRAARWRLHRLAVRVGLRRSPAHPVRGSRSGQEVHPTVGKEDPPRVRRQCGADSAVFLKRSAVRALLFGREECAARRRVCALGARGPDAGATTADRQRRDLRGTTHWLVASGVADRRLGQRTHARVRA